MKLNYFITMSAILLIALNLNAQVKPVTGKFTDSRDGKVYETVKIGNQTWMAENLVYLAKADCWAPNNDMGNSGTFGFLYSWDAAKKACPAGWHLPKETEWNTLITCLGGEDVAGGKMKVTPVWKSPNKDATNSSGFNALPSGTRNPQGIFSGFGSNADYWAADDYSVYNTKYFFVSYIHSRAGNNISYKTNGFSVRCIKD